MAWKKQAVADLLFWVQIIGAFIFCGTYFVRSLYDVTGSSVVQFYFVATFLFFCLTLSIGAYKEKPDRPTRQGIITYAVWLVLIIAVSISTALNREYLWSDKETVMLVVGGTSLLAVCVVGVCLRVKVTDPMIRGLLAISFKAIPQIFLAWKFFQEGASGTPLTAIIVGHVTILVRLGQIYFMVRESGWDRNRKWLALSEFSNEVSWLAVSFVWILVL